MNKMKRGDKVICVSVFEKNPLGYTERGPRLDGIYTIRGFVDIPGGIGLLLNEITNHPQRYK